MEKIAVHVAKLPNVIIDHITAKTRENVQRLEPIGNLQKNKGGNPE